MYKFIQSIPTRVVGDIRTFKVFKAKTSIATVQDLVDAAGRGDLTIEYVNVRHGESRAHVNMYSAAAAADSGSI